jgi:hypothetical protein
MMLSHRFQIGVVLLACLSGAVLNTLIIADSRERTGLQHRLAVGSYVLLLASLVLAIRAVRRSSR